MPRPPKQPDEPISRGEAIILLRYIVDTMRLPSPKGGFYSLLHRDPVDVAKQYSMSVEAVLRAARRKLPKKETA